MFWEGASRQGTALVSENHRARRDERREKRREEDEAAGRRVSKREDIISVEEWVRKQTAVDVDVEREMG